MFFGEKIYTLSDKDVQKLTMEEAGLLKWFNVEEPEKMLEVAELAFGPGWRKLPFSSLEQILQMRFDRSFLNASADLRFYAFRSIVDFVSKLTGAQKSFLKEHNFLPRRSGKNLALPEYFSEVIELKYWRDSNAALVQSKSEMFEIITTTLVRALEQRRSGARIQVPDFGFKAELVRILDERQREDERLHRQNVQKKQEEADKKAGIVRTVVPEKKGFFNKFFSR